MATTDEIERRVAEADAARTVTRSMAAQRVGELAARRADIAGQLRDVERELGDVLAAAGEVIDIDELARFTDVPAADLTRFLTSRKPTRSSTKHKRSATGGKNDAQTKTGSGNQSSVVRTPTKGQAPTVPESSANLRGDAAALVLVAAPGT